MRHSAIVRSTTTMLNHFRLFGKPTKKSYIPCKRTAKIKQEILPFFILLEKIKSQLNPIQHMWIKSEEKILVAIIPYKI